MCRTLRLLYSIKRYFSFCDNVQSIYMYLKQPFACHRSIITKIVLWKGNFVWKNLPLSRRKSLVNESILYGHSFQQTSSFMVTPFSHHPPLWSLLSAIILLYGHSFQQSSSFMVTIFSNHPPLWSLLSAITLLYGHSFQQSPSFTVTPFSDHPPLWSLLSAITLLYSHSFQRSSSFMVTPFSDVHPHFVPEYLYHFLGFHLHFKQNRWLCCISCCTLFCVADTTELAG